MRRVLLLALVLPALALAAAVYPHKTSLPGRACTDSTRLTCWGPQETNAIADKLDEHDARIGALESGQSGGGTTTPGTVNVTSVYLYDVPVAPATLAPGGSAQVSADILPVNALRTDLVWSTTAGSATGPGATGGGAASGYVSTSGVYTAPATAGTYRVWAVSKDATCSNAVAGNRCQDYCNVVVSGGAGTLAIAPVTITTTTGGTQTFAASGGTSPYAWTLSANRSGATLGSATGSSSLYTAGSTGGGVIDTVRLCDAASACVTAQSTVGASNLGALGAFPGCQGAGCGTRGGFASGSTTYLVTSLSTGTGAGTLGACIAASGPRVCLFRVAGSIDSTGYQIANDGITIDGRTAPGMGVQIKAKSGTMAAIYQTGNDSVIRGLKLRPGYNSGSHGDGAPGRAINVKGSTTRLVVDHNSLQWGNGGQVSDWTNTGNSSLTDHTFSWNIIGESLDSGTSGYGYNFNTGASSHTLAEGMTNIDIHHNYFASGHERNPTWKFMSGRFVNNVVYNWEADDGTQFRGGGAPDIISNVWRPGNNSNSTTSTIHFPGDTQNESPSGSPRAYMEGNISAGFPTTSSGANWVSGIANETDSTLANLAAAKRSPYAALSTPSGGTAIIADSAGTVAAPVGSVIGSDTDITGLGTNAGVLGLAGAVMRLDCAGRLVMRRDAQDSKMVRYYATPGSTPNLAPTDESGYGGYPSIPSVSSTCGGTATDNTSCACADSDSDGIPDVWELAKCGSTTGCSPSATSVAGPWTNLEAYLSGLRPAN